MQLTDILGIAVFVAAISFYFLSKKSSNKKGEGKKEPESSLDLLDYEEISDDGLVIMPGNRFRGVLAVEPINFALTSPREQAAIWSSYRAMLNSTNLPISIVIQSKELDIKDYLEELETGVSDIDIPELKRYGEALTKELKTRIEEQKITTKHYYIIVKFDANKSGVNDHGANADQNPISQVIETIQQKIAQRKSTQQADHEKIARQELENMVQVIMSQTSNMGLRTKPLNKIEIENFIYATYNKDIASHARLADMYNQGCFRLTPDSATPFIYEEEFMTDEEKEEHIKELEEEAKLEKEQEAS